MARAIAGPVSADVAVRHDRFNRFKDATSLRGSALVDARPRRLALAASYGEGIAQPTFFDLYGFFPGSFVGNPSLKPESSRGFEGRCATRRGDDWSAALTCVPPAAEGRDRRSVRSRHFPWLDCQCRRHEPPLGPRGRRWAGRQVRALRADRALRVPRCDPAERGRGRPREVRRPKHSGSVALDGQSGRLSYGASLAYTGARIDNNFEISPFGRVRLGAYWLAGARLAYAVRPGIELFARVANAFDERLPGRRSAIAPKEGAFMPASALLIGASAARLASLNLCTDEYAAAARTPGQIGQRHPPRRTTRAKRRSWRRRGRIAANRGAMEEVVARRPTRS